MTARDRLHRLVDGLPENELVTAERVLTGLSVLSLSNHAMAALAKAPGDDEPVTDREAERIEEGERDLRDGRTVTGEVSSHAGRPVTSRGGASMGSTVDKSEMLAFVASCDDPEKLRTIEKNARKRGADALADAAFRRLVSVLPSERPGTVEHDFWRSVHTLEEVLTKERGRKTPLSRTRRKVDRVGVRQTLADWVLKPEKTTGFDMLLERNMPELLGEAVILRHPDEFETDVVGAARTRLEASGVDIAKVTAYGRTMEETRPILRDAVGHNPSSRNLASIIRSHFGPSNGVELELPPREPAREPPSFD